MVARRRTRRPGLGARRLRVVLVSACLLAHARGRAEERSVTVACPQLDREAAAEIESRARAALLTSDLRASITIDCEAEAVVVSAQSAAESSSVRATPASATFRDEVLAAVDAALEQLRSAPAPGIPPAGSNVADAAPPEPPAPVAPAPLTAAQPAATAAPAPSTAPPVQTVPAPPNTSHAEVYAAAGLEAWSAGVAGTASLGARGGGRYFRLGVRGGAARQLAQDQSFSATELSLTVEALLALDFAGLRAALSAGPSWLAVSPSGDVTALGDSSTTALVVSAELSRPVWLGRFAVVPALGIRGFSSKRGVRLDRSERLVLGGYQPSVTLALLYQID